MGYKLYLERKKMIINVSKCTECPLATIVDLDYIHCSAVDKVFYLNEKMLFPIDCPLKTKDVLITNKETD